MKQSSLFRKASVVALSAVCCVALAGCSGTDSYGYTGGVAATVNGTEIAEDTVTKYIQDFRTSSDLTTDEDWANWMIDNSMDPSTVRSQVIDYYTEIELAKQACEERGLTVEDSEVEEYYDSMKSNYDSDEAWEEALAEAGITEEQYKESIQAGLREEKLMESVAEESDTTASDEDVLTMLNTYYSMFDGAKKSSHILFDASDTETAQSVLDQINAGTLDFAEAAMQYSTDTGSAEDGGNVGWDSLSSFVTEYTDALDQLSEGQVSGLVTSDYGIHIIKCTEEWHGDGTATSLDEYPTEFVEYVRNIVEQQNESTAYSTWFEEYEEQADIQINDMPENVPYNLDLTQYETEDESADESTDSSTDTTTDTTTEESTEDSTDTSTDATTTESTDTATSTDSTTSTESTSG